MALILNEEESMLRESAAAFLDEHAGPDLMRQLRDQEDELGYRPQLWQAMAELGWTGVLVPDDLGGLGFSHVGMGQIVEQIGRTLAASPLVSSAITATVLVLGGGSKDQKAQLLPRLAAGELTMALAVDEGPRHDPRATALKAEQDGDQVVLSGTKRFVEDGHFADQVIVLARSSGEAGQSDGLSLYLVDGDVLQRTAVPAVDSRRWGELQFDGVRIPGGQQLGQPGRALEVLEPALDVTRIYQCAELLGLSRECFDVTLRYLKERQQFGVPIGSFQALQHRAAILWTELELAQSLVLSALKRLDQGDPPGQVSRLASAAKTKLSRVAQLATNEAIQMHGGIGMTDVLDMGLYLKRARVLEAQYGDQRYHASRFARLSGY